MLGHLRHARLSALALALYALATLVVGFAHRPLALAGADHALAELALQADSPLSLCDHDGGTPASPHATDRICDACALISSPGLPPTNHCTPSAPVSRRLTLAFRATAQFAPAALHAPLSRGPPAA